MVSALKIHHGMVNFQLRDDLERSIIASMYRRNVEERVGEAIGHSRVVLINGPRQAEKTTLVRNLIEIGEGAESLTFDDITTLSYA